MPTRNIICIGDSTTVYWPPMLQALLPDVTVTNFGVAGTHDSDMADHFDAHPENWNDFVIFFGGINDSWNYPLIKAGFDRIVARLNHTDYVIMVPLNGSDQAIADHAHMVDLKASLEAAYPGKVWDVRSHLIANYANPQRAQDMIDQANDTVPASLRGDAIHPNTFGCHLIAEFVFDQLSAAGKIYPLY